MTNLVQRAKLFGTMGILAVATTCSDAEQKQRPLVVPADLTSFYQTMQQNAEAFARTDGEWAEHYGDAPYGLAFYSRAAHALDREDYREVAAAARDHNFTVVSEAAASLLVYLANVESSLMAALGLVEYLAQAEDAAAVEALDALIDSTNNYLGLTNNYLPPALEEEYPGVALYGATALTAAVALLNLQYAKEVAGPKQAERIANARLYVEAIEEQAFDGERYLFTPAKESLFLYPNALMLLVLNRLYELTHENVYLDRARTVARAIEPLKNSERGGYNSPYSAEQSGAQTEDYSTLSSQNYLSLGFLLLYQNTGNVDYFDRAIEVLEFIRTHLYQEDEGRLLHHWIDGRLAHRDDPSPSYWCSGCNLQFLYVLWYLHDVVLA